MQNEFEWKIAPNNCCDDKTNSLNCKLEWACRIFVDCAKKLFIAEWHQFVDLVITIYV
jgi:hypothetical protein